MDQAVGNTSFTVENWSSIPSLVHGFGTRDMTEGLLRTIGKMTGLTPVLLRQIHSDIIHPLTSAPGNKPRGDALLTDRPGLLLVIKTADCLPVLFLSEKPRAIAAVHCGWRGTDLGLVTKTVRKMKILYACDPAALEVALGPSIEPECYEVGEEVRREFGFAEHIPNVFRPHPLLKNKHLFDLRQANRLQLLSCGVRSENIHSFARCTRCEAKFHSYRRDPLDSNRMLNYIGLLPEKIRLEP